MLRDAETGFAQPLPDFPELAGQAQLDFDFDLQSNTLMHRKECCQWTRCPRPIYSQSGVSGFASEPVQMACVTNWSGGRSSSVGLMASSTAVELSSLLVLRNSGPSTGRLERPAMPFIVQAWLDVMRPAITPHSPSRSRTFEVSLRLEIIGMPLTLLPPRTLNSVSRSSVTSSMP